MQQLEAAHDECQVVGVRHLGVAFVGEDARGGVVAEHAGAREHTLRQGGDALHAGLNLLEVFGVARAFIFCHPVARVCHPVGTDTQTGRRRAGIFLARQRQTHRVDGVEHLVGILHGRHQVARALIGRQVVVEAVPRRLRDTGFLSTAAPMADVVATAKSGKRSDVIDIHLAGVTCHRLRHAPHIGARRTQEAVPQPRDAAQLRVVPREAAYVVLPFMAGRIVLVHHVAVVPETIPVAFIDGFHVVVEIVLQQVFHLSPLRIRAVGQAPDAKGTA